MNHAVVGETRQAIYNLLMAISDWLAEPMSQIRGTVQNYVLLRCIYSGRLDRAYIITSEHNIHDHRFDGQVMQTDDSTYVDGLLMYVRHNLKRERFGGLIDDDPETLCWHWATENTLRGFAGDNRPCFNACIQSVEAAERSRQRR